MKMNSPKDFNDLILDAVTAVRPTVVIDTFHYSSAYNFALDEFTEQTVKVVKEQLNTKIKAKKELAKAKRRAEYLKLKEEFEDES
mgnify:CR=1 FL=1